MIETEIKPEKEQALTITSLLMISYGLLLCATNRTKHHLFIRSISFTRIGQGTLLAIIGLLILLLQYGFKEEKPPKKRKRRPRQ